jgi:hypothetical protein
VTNLTPREIINKITEGLTETRKQFQRPKAATNARNSAQQVPNGKSSGKSTGASKTEQRQLRRSR